VVLVRFAMQYPVEPDSRNTRSPLLLSMVRVVSVDPGTVADFDHPLFVPM
jgi:hypothetical protein